MELTMAGFERPPNLTEPNRTVPSDHWRPSHPLVPSSPRSGAWTGRGDESGGALRGNLREPLLDGLVHLQGRQPTAPRGGKALRALTPPLVPYWLASRASILEAVVGAFFEPL